MNDPVKHRIEKTDRKEAEQISTWKYQEPYSIYNMDGSEECLSELFGGLYYSVFDGEDNLVGYFCYGKSAQVPAGNEYGAYDNDEYTDIGLGIRPDLCGIGLGLDFLKEGLGFARKRFFAGKFRLTVAGFNQRAIKVYERAGFIKRMSFDRVSEREKMEFLIMTID